MKQFIQKTAILLTGALMLTGFASFAFASVSFNTDGSDYATLRAANTTQHPNTNSCWSTSIPGTSSQGCSNSALAAGERLSLTIYFHNTGTTPASNVTFRLSPQTTPNGTIHGFTGYIFSDGVLQAQGSVSVQTTSAQTISFDPSNPAYVYPTQAAAQANQKTFLSSGQASALFGTGYVLGTVQPGWPTQGSVVVNFVVSNAQQAQCSINSFGANPNSVASGNNTTLSWTTSNCTSVNISNVGGPFPANGSTTTGALFGTTTFTLTATGPNNTVSQSTTVSVTQPLQCSITSFTPNPSSVITGNSSTLSWTTSNCTSASISGLGPVSPNGSISTGALSTTTPFTLTAVGNNTVSQSTTVYVTQPQTYQCSDGIDNDGDSFIDYPQDPGCSSLTDNTESPYNTVSQCVINSFNANPANITSGGTTTVSWMTSNCTSVSISGINGTFAPNGSASTGQLYGTTLFTLTATGPNNSVSQNANVTVVQQTYQCSNGIDDDGDGFVDMQDPGCSGATDNTESPFNTVPLCTVSSFHATPTSVNAGGTSTLSWTATNCTSVTISGITGNFAQSGSANTGQLYTTTLFTLTATGANNSVSQNTNVTVIQPQYQCSNGIDDDGDGYIDYPSDPGCSGATDNTESPFNAVLQCTINSFSANPANIQTGGTSTLSWTSSHCNSVTISGINGTFAPNGSASTGALSTSTLFTLTAVGVNTVSQNTNVTVSQQTFQCNDNIDNDGDGYTDYPSDPGCASATDNTESPYNLPTAQCNDGIDNDGDGFTDMQDPGCSYAFDTSEAPFNYAQCSISSFVATPSSVASGSQSVLTWNTQNCNSVTITGLSGTFPANGSTNTNALTAAQAFTLTAQGANNSPTQTITVAVVQPSQCHVTSFSANPASVLSGASSTLSWTSQNCQSVTIGGISGTFAPSGSASTGPLTASTLFTLTATGANNSVSQNTNITVTQQTYQCSDSVDNDGDGYTDYPSDPGCASATDNTESPYNSQPQTAQCTISSFIASPYSVSNGGISTLSWVTNNCNTVSITNIGNSLPANGSSVTNPIYGTTVFTLTATGTNGSPSQNVTVYANQTNNQCSISSFYANPSSIANGNSATLYWNTQNCNSVSISNLGGSFSANSSTTTNPIYGTTTFTLTAYGNNGSVSQSTTVYTNQNGSQCTISAWAVPSSVSAGQSSTIYWSGNNCSSVYVSGFGNSYGQNGSVVTNPLYSTQSFTVSGYSNNGGANGNATVTVYVNQSNSYQCNDGIDNDGDGYIDMQDTGCSSSTDSDEYNASQTQVLTTVASSLSTSAARINGYLVATSGATSGYFEWGTTVSLGRTTSSQSLGSSAPVTFVDTLTGLSPNTFYYFRAVVTNAQGTFRGEIIPFRTSAAATNTNSNTNTTNTTTTIVRNVTVGSGTGSPLVELSIDDRLDAIYTGDVLNYVVHYKNISGITLNNTVLRVILPKGIEFKSTSAGVYNSNDRAITVDIRTLLPNQEGNVFFSADVTSAKVGELLVATASMAFTRANSLAQDDAVAYELNTLAVRTNTSSLAGLALFSGTFFPGTFLGWLIILLLILLVILFARRVYQDRSATSRGAHH